MNVHGHEIRIQISASSVDNSLFSFILYLRWYPRENAATLQTLYYCGAWLRLLSLIWVGWWDPSDQALSTLGLVCVFFSSLTSSLGGINVIVCLFPFDPAQHVNNASSSSSVHHPIQFIRAHGRTRLGPRALTSPHLELHHELGPGLHFTYDWYICRLTYRFSKNIRQLWNQHRMLECQKCLFWWSRRWIRRRRRCAREGSPW